MSWLPVGVQMGRSPREAYIHSPAVRNPIVKRFTACCVSRWLPLPVTRRHDFFDSGLLYQFCINFRRRRRLSELLNEEQDNGEGTAVHTHEDNHPDSPFILRKDPRQESTSGFHSG